MILPCDLELEAFGPEIRVVLDRNRRAQNDRKLLDYRERYLLEVNARYDGSSRFRPKNRWGFFPSVSVGWNIANEKFMENVKGVVNMLKIRVSYGSLGNQYTNSHRGCGSCCPRPGSRP